MRLDRFANELELILLLTDNHSYTAQQLADKLHTTRRNIYHYFEYFRGAGFVLRHQGDRYYLEKNAPFFRQLHYNIAFTQQEAQYMREKLEKSARRQPMARAIMMKLDRYYDLHDRLPMQVMQRVNRNADALRDAIEHHQVVVLRAYSSPHSRSVSDRRVEPFLLMNDDMDVRCYELDSGVCKTFKLARIEEVVPIGAYWLHEAEHRQVFTDIFMFSGEEKHHVKLRLRRLSYNLLLEEYPYAELYVAPEEARDTWLFETDVASYVGIGRFVLGLYADIEVIADDGLRTYLHNQIHQMQASLPSASPLSPCNV